MSIEQITDHEQQAIARLLSQFDNAPNVQAFLGILAAPCQDIEDTFVDIALDRLLDTAVGAQLDQLGLIVGAQRRDYSDDDYRKYIRIRILANRSNGQTDVILRVVEFLVGVAVSYFLFTPASYQIAFEQDAVSLDLLALLAEILPEVSPAGVAYTVVEAPSADAKRFGIDGRGFDTGLFGRVIITG